MGGADGRRERRVQRWQWVLVGSLGTVLVAGIVVLVLFGAALSRVSGPDPRPPGVSGSSALLARAFDDRLRTALQQGPVRPQRLVVPGIEIQAVAVRGSAAQVYYRSSYRLPAPAEPDERCYVAEIDLSQSPPTVYGSDRACVRVLVPSPVEVLRPH